MTLIGYVVFLAFPLAMLYAAASDLFTMTIDNLVTVFLGVAFLVAAPILGMDLATFGLHWLAGLTVLLVGFGLFAVGWIGGADAKIAAVAALWFGFGGLVEFLTLTCVFGGVLTLGLLAFRRLPLPVTVVRQPWVARLHHPETGVPYGIALAAASVVAYPHSVWIGLAA